MTTATARKPASPLVAAIAFGVITAFLFGVGWTIYAAATGRLDDARFGGRPFYDDKLISSIGTLVVLVIAASAYGIQRARLRRV